MTLSVNFVGDNPQTPGIAAETYIPDQLIAGNLKLVTDTVSIGGSAVLQRGSLLGQSSLSTIASSAGKTFATGTVTVALVPTALDTLTIAGTAITFVTANPRGNQVQIGGAGTGGQPPTTPTIAGTCLALIDFLVGSTDANLLKANYSLSGAVVTINANKIGTGNALTLATSHAAAFTLSSTTLADGSANAGAESIGSISAGPLLKAGTYMVILESATVGHVEDPTGVDIGPFTVGTAFTDQQINFTVTTGSNIAAGDMFALQAAVGAGTYILASAAALDGSQNPVAILADYADPTGGAVNAGVYLMGEFNTNAMTFGPGISVAAAKTALRPLGIFLKTGAVVATDPS